MAHRSLPHAVYRHFDADGGLLYIGASHDPRARFMGHRSASSWAFLTTRIEIEWFADKATALAAEAAAITAERPPHNGDVGSNRRGKRAPPNVGHLYLADWLDFSGVSIAEFAGRARMTTAEARKLATGPASPRHERAVLITAATDGYVPYSAWSPRSSVTAFHRLSREQAVASRKDAQESLDRWASYAVTRALLAAQAAA